jgi:MOSC domain-containing protein YiiM
LGRTLSGIDKKPVSGPQRVMSLGLVGDSQADMRVHGGVDKAVHAYPWAHYSMWQQRLPGHALLQAPGAFGENLSVEGMDEHDVCIGDRWRIGSVLFEVSQGRQPCFKLNLRFGVSDMAAQVQESLRAGWYLRVLEPGELRAGDEIEVLERPHSEWTIARVLTIIRDREVDPAVLKPLLGLPLPPSWRRLFERRLESSQIED